MPPLFHKRLESVTQHGVPKYHAVRILLISNILVIRMAQLSEIIKSTAHIHLFFRLHIEQRQIHGASPAVSGMFGNIFLRKQSILFKFRIKVLFHFHVIRIQRPVHKVGYSHLRAVSVEYFEPVSLRDQIVTHLFKCCGSFLCQERQRLLITGYALADKIVG